MPDTDFVQHCFNRPKSVFSSDFSKVSSAVDHVVAHYQIASGVCVTAEGNWAMTHGFGFNMVYNAVFEAAATVDYDLSRGEESLKL
ncbi:MAG: hypothetical protein M2R45_00929 [Verrucomicrobia subdivision 3 bacterium]|nr:hypothetical protein [Limisphaerales bacterium]MCS1414598.1 hypothetical protein [Limisphaerales bacterium]